MVIQAQTTIVCAERCITLAAVPKGTRVKLTMPATKIDRDFEVVSALSYKLVN